MSAAVSIRGVRVWRRWHDVVVVGATLRALAPGAVTLRRRMP